jgi:hypothetical protein
MLNSSSILRKNDAHLIKKNDVWEKKTIVIVALNLQKYF